MRKEIERFIKNLQFKNVYNHLETSQKNSNPSAQLLVQYKI